MDRAARRAKAASILKTPSPAERIAKSGFAPSVKVAQSDSYKNLVFGWANVAFTDEGQVTDGQGHLIDIEDLENAAYSFVVKYADTPSDDMHLSAPFGRLVESMVYTPEKLEALGLTTDQVPLGWWVGMEVPADHHEAVRSGKRTMLSIGGSAKLEPVS